MGLLTTIVVGLIVGAVARAVMPGPDPAGWFVTLALGVGGAFLAGVLGRGFGWYQPDQAPGVIASVLGAMLVLYLRRRGVGRGAKPSA